MKNLNETVVAFKLPPKKNFSPIVNEMLQKTSNNPEN